MNVTYDSRNRVVRRTSPNGTLNLTYSGWNLIEERNGGGELEQTYVHGAGTDEMLVKISSSGPAYYHHDGLGSTIALTGENGELLESYRYDAFGGVTVYDSSGSALPASPRGNRFLFTGREWLGQAGIYDYRNRVYSASLGRFLQTDPIRFEAGDVNLYRYVGNSAANYVDPTGEFANIAIGAGLGFVGGFATDIALQAANNMANGDAGNSNLDYGSAAVSGGFGAVSGATGLGALTQGKNAYAAFRKANQFQRNLNNRAKATQRGKFRNPEKTAKQRTQRNEALGDAAAAAGKGSIVPIVKEGFNELNDSNKGGACP